MEDDAGGKEGEEAVALKVQVGHVVEANGADGGGDGEGHFDLLVGRGGGVEVAEKALAVGVQPAQAALFVEERAAARADRAPIEVENAGVGGVEKEVYGRNR